MDVTRVLGRALGVVSTVSTNQYLPAVDIFNPADSAVLVVVDGISKDHLQSEHLSQTNAFVNRAHITFPVQAAHAADYMFQGAGLPPITTLYSKGFASKAPYIACMSYDADKVSECHDATTKISYNNDGFVDESGRILASYSDVMTAFTSDASLLLPGWTVAAEGNVLVVLSPNGVVVEFNLENPEVSAFFLELGYSLSVAKSTASADSKSLLVLFNTGVTRIMTTYGSTTSQAQTALKIFDAFLPAIMAASNKGRTVGVSVFNDFHDTIVLREMRELAAASPALPVATPSQMNMNDVDTFQVILWTAILLALTVYFAVNAVATMEFSPEINSLYAKFNSE